MRIKSKKKLALLVSMALTVGSTLAVNPMDVYAASVTWDAVNNKYSVTVNGNSENKDTADDAVSAVIKGITSGDDKDFIIDFTESAWSDKTDEAKALVTALGDQAVTLQGGAKVDLTYADGGRYAFTNGADKSTLTLGKSDNVLTINGDMDSVNVTVGSNNAAEIKVADDKVVNSIIVNDGSANELKLTGNGTVSNLEAQGDITVSATDTKLTNIAVAEGKTLTTSGAVTAGSITGNGNVTANGALNVTGDISAASVTTTGALSATNINATNVEATGKITATKVTAGTVKAESVTADVKADSLELTGSTDVTVDDSAKKWEVGTLKTGGNLTVSDASKFTANTIESTGALNISDANNTLGATNITSGGKLTIADGTKVAPGANIKTEGGLTVTDGDLNAGSLSVNGELNAGDKTITADSIAFGKNATIAAANTSIKADAVTIDTTSMTKENIAKLNIAPKAEGGTVNVKVVTTGGALDEDTQKAIEQATGGSKVIVNVTSADAEKAKTGADEAIAKADEALKQVNEFAAKDAAEVAYANPFITKLPSASDIAAVASPTKDQLKDLTTAKTSLESAINGVNAQIEAAKQAKNETMQKDLEAKKVELERKVEGLSTDGLKAKAAELTAAVQQAGKTAAAPGVASARTATVVTNVMTANVTGRTSELRGFASAVDEGRPAPDNVWFQYKHTNMDVDNGDVYGKSTVKTNNYQLGYDAKVGPNDYLGAYIGTTTGNVEFNAPAVTDRTDIDNAYDFGIYGTHMLPSDQYIDYMIHTGKFDSKYNGVTWGTKDTGAMIGYGAKIAQNDRLTWNPYIQLAYDKVSVDGYMAGPNYIASDDSNNWTAKLGINLLDVSGFYGGLAYSRGLSGSYNAYINGVPMPSQDNNANVLYMSLGYRANMSRNVFLDLSMEKTFADYNGWTAAGKVNFYF